MAVGQGVATLDFGAFPGANQASVTVTGQSQIGATSKAEAFFMGDDTSGTHTANDHRYAPLFISLTCGTPTAGAGFSIHGRCLEKMQGSFQVRYVWSD